MSKNLATFGSAVANDLLSCFAIPGGGTLGNLAGAFMEGQQKKAVETFLEELSNGFHGEVAFEEADIDPLISILLRYSKAASDGAAIINLRLLSQVVLGLKKNKTLYDDNFRRWCAVLEHLTRAELLMIGFSIVIDRELQMESPDEHREGFWQQLQQKMDAGGYGSSEISSLAASVSRYGILVPVSAYGGLNYVASDWLRQLGGLVDTDRPVFPEGWFMLGASGQGSRTGGSGGCVCNLFLGIGCD